MKTRSLLVLLLFFSFSHSFAQFNVTGIYTDYNGFWQSSTTSINPTKPELSHNMLAFTWNGSTFSTGVNDALLTAKGTSYVPKDFRAFPIDAVNASGASGNTTYIGMGQLQDGVANGGSTPAPFPTPAGASGLASFLTDGPKGLDIGTGIANIAAGNLRFNLSALGISASAIGDGVPDVVVTQVASPSSSQLDSVYFISASGASVGNRLSINHSEIPVTGRWMPDFYMPSGAIAIKNSERDIRLWAADLSSFGITAANVGQAVALIYKLNGQSDVAFVAFNVPSISVATQLVITSQPPASVNPGCCGNTSTAVIPQHPVIQVRDASGNNILQEDILVTATILSGPVGHGPLSGTTTVRTNSAGAATFANLMMPCETGSYVLQFTSSNLEPASSGNISVVRPQYFVKPTGTTNLSALSSWSTAMDGSGTIPDNFGTGKEFILNNAAANVSYATGGNWTVSGKLTIPSGKTLTITTNTTTTLSCEIAHSGTIQAGTSSTVILNGTSPQMLAGTSNITNLTINNSAGVTVSGPTTVANNLALTSGTLTVNAAALTLNGPISRNAGNINASSASTLITFAGAEAQVVPSSTFTGSVRSLTVNNSSGLTINSSVTVSNTLTLTNGRLTIGNHNLIAGNTSGGSTSAYVRTNGTGRLQQHIATGSQVTFPVGNSSYNPTTITNNAAVDQFAVRVLDEMYSNSTDGDAIPHARITRSWNVQKTNPNSGAGFAMLFNWAPAQNNGVATPSLYAYDSKWTKQTTGVSSMPTINSFNYAGYTGNGAYFGMLESAAVLPVIWKDFTVSSEGKRNILRWTTSTERNTKEFVAERSSTGATWLAIGRVPASQSSVNSKEYRLFDNAPIAGDNFYRIRQVDIDGESSHSEVRVIRLTSAAEFLIINNPVVNKQIIIRTGKPEELSLHDLNGRTIWKRSVSAGTHRIDASHLPRGTFVISSSNSAQQIIVR